MKDDRYRVRNVPREIQVRFKHRAELSGMKVGEALTQAMAEWIARENEKEK